MAFTNIVYHQGYIHSLVTISSRFQAQAASPRPLNLSFPSTLTNSNRLPSTFFAKIQLHATNTPLSSSAIMAAGTVNEVLPPALDSSSAPPAIFDGTTKLYISYICPFAQRVWIARNYKGLQDKIKLVPIDLQNRPDWYKEKVYPPNKVPALEHNNEVIGESLDLLKYLESNFDGPPVLPDDPAKKEFAEQLLSYTDTFGSTVISAFKGNGTEAGVVFDYLENALGKFDDGPFFLGSFSLVDIAYAPFIERFQPFLFEVKKYDVTENRPKLAAWIEAINKIEAYTVTKQDPKVLLEQNKKRFGVQ